MTQHEQVSLQELVQEFRQYKADDAEWKLQIESQIKPLVEERLDHIIVQKYGKLAFKGIVTVLGAIATVLIILKTIADIRK